MNFESWVFSIRSPVENSLDLFIYKGSDILRPPTAEACFRSRASRCEFCGGQCGKERGFFSPSTFYSPLSVPSHQ